MNEPTERPPRICATCRQALDVFVDAATGESSYIHGPQDDDHEPQPIPTPDDWLGRCDFCNFGIPRFVLPVRPFDTMRLEGPDGSRTHGSADDWIACADCAPLIESNQWGAIARRSEEGHRRVTGEPLNEAGKTTLRHLHRQVRKNTTGPLKPLEEGR